VFLHHLGVQRHPRRLGAMTTATARQASDTLTIALLNMAERGERTHCSDPTSHHLWLSEHESERAVAVMLCDHCPVLTVCRQTAELRQESCGVWGGRDTHAGEGLSHRTGAAPLARLVHERSALDDFEVLAGGLILVEMAEGDSNLQRLERAHDSLGLRDALLVVLRCLQLGGDARG
jgi:hypothetical protein